MKRSHALALVLSVGAINAALAWADKKPLNFGFILDSSKVAGLLVALFTIYEFWLWRIPLLFPWFTPVPNIRGTWALSVRANVPANDQPRVESDTGTIEIRQSYSTIGFSILWQNGTTTETQGKYPISASEAGQCVFSATYLIQPTPNSPEVPARQAAFFFSTQMQHPDTVTVHYLTTDGQIGTAWFTQRRPSTLWQRLRPA